jgi:preprotein translocase subunit SecF
MSTTTKPIKTTSRPGRTLAILGLILVSMVSLVFLQDSKSLQLGLDLRGGTSVTLQPRIAQTVRLLSLFQVIPVDELLIWLVRPRSYVSVRFLHRVRVFQPLPMRQRHLLWE